MMQTLDHGQTTQVAETAARVAAGRRRDLLAGGPTEVDLSGTNACPARLNAVAAAFFSAGVVLGMLQDGWLRLHISPAHDRLFTLAGIVLLSAALAVRLTVHADGRHDGHASPDDRVSHVGLDPSRGSVILHAAIGRRWPLARAGVR